MWPQYKGLSPTPLAIKKIVHSRTAWGGGSRGTTEILGLIEIGSSGRGSSGGNEMDVRSFNRAISKHGLRGRVCLSQCTIYLHFTCYDMNVHTTHKASVSQDTVEQIMLELCDANYINAIFF
jgi:hypothetical protein